MRPDNQRLHLVILPQQCQLHPLASPPHPSQNKKGKTYQILRHGTHHFLPLGNTQTPNQLLHPPRQPRMPIPRDVRLEIHLVPPRIHHGKRVVLVLIVPEPRVIRQAREDELPTTTATTSTLTLTLTVRRRRRRRLGPLVAVLGLGRRAVRGDAKDVREVLVAFVFGKLGDLDGGPGAADGLLLLVVVGRGQGRAGGGLGAAGAATGGGLG